jgi:hypothetical protein
MPTEAFLLSEAVDFHPPLGRKALPHLRSRLLVKPDRTTIPVLTRLAEEKFGVVPEGFFPFWLDGDPSNETLENVELAAKPSAVPRGIR